MALSLWPLAKSNSAPWAKNQGAFFIERLADYFEELRTASSGYLTSIVSDEEERASGRLFGRRRRQEMAEDPMHAGWLEEEREKKRLEKLRKAKSSGKRGSRKAQTSRTGSRAESTQGQGRIVWAEPFPENNATSQTHSAP